MLCDTGMQKLISRYPQTKAETAGFRLIFQGRHWHPGPVLGRAECQNYVSGYIWLPQAGNGSGRAAKGAGLNLSS
jgi:hypothetical protein